MKISKTNIKQMVDDLFDAHGVRRQSMADDLHLTKGRLSQILSPNNEADGFVFGYMRPMLWLEENYPQVFTNIDTFVQTQFKEAHAPSHLAIAQDEQMAAIRLNHLSMEAGTYLIDKRKSAHEKRAKLAELAGLIAELQRSYEERFTPQEVAS